MFFPWHIGQKIGWGLLCLICLSVSFTSSKGMLLDLDVLLGEAELYQDIPDDGPLVAHE